MSHTTYRYRAVSPDGKYPEGWDHWPTWTGLTLEEVIANRDEWHPGYFLQVEETTVTDWRQLESTPMAADDLTWLRGVAEAAMPRFGWWKAENLQGATFDKRHLTFIATFDPPTVAALIDRVERAERERDELAQAMWDGRAELGFDTDGDTGPGAWIAGAKSYRVFAENWLRDVREHRTEADEADAEWSQDIDRLDASEAALAALRAAVEGLADEWECPDPDGRYGYSATVHRDACMWCRGADELRALLTEGADDGQ